MPILQLGEWENFEGVSLLDWNAPICLMATMLYPSNERRREEAAALARAAKPYHDAASFNRTLGNIVVERFAEPKPRQYGVVAGRILYLIRRIADHHPGYEAGVNKAVSIIEAELESTPRSEREGCPASKTFIREAWASHKSVAHLWAALALSVSFESITTTVRSLRPLGTNMPTGSTEYRSKCLGWLRTGSTPQKITRSDRFLISPSVHVDSPTC